MKQKRYIKILLPVLAVAWMLPTSCDDKYNDSWDSQSHNIEFEARTLTVQTRLSETDQGMRNEFKEGDSFGVLGYCVPCQIGSTIPDYSAGSSVWTTKISNAVPDVFNRQKVTLTSNDIWQYDYNNVDGEQTTYNPKYWYADGKDTENNDAGCTNTENYRYDFFAYYPYRSDVFTWEKPTSDTDKGAPRVKVSVPQSGGDNMDPVDTPDAMLSVIHNYQRQINSRVAFNFSHIFTALGFEVNNFSERELQVHSIKLTGTFWKSLTVDFKEGSYTYNETDTYEGTYVLFDESVDGGTLILSAPGENETSTSSPSPIGGEYLRLLPGGFKGENYIGSDVELIIDYTFDEGRESKTYTRPGTFLPQSGMQYTSQLNFVGGAFVLQFVVDNSESWEDGESDNDGDITFD